MLKVTKNITIEITAEDIQKLRDMAITAKFALDKGLIASLTEQQAQGVRNFVIDVLSACQ